MSANLIFFFFSFVCLRNAGIDRLAPTRRADGLTRATVPANIRWPHSDGRQRGTFERRRNAISEELRPFGRPAGSKHLDFRLRAHDRKTQSRRITSAPVVRDWVWE
uniref:Secreted protein n=1 Tax=Plectus sambesii TaxID=2011161 RepID=A0A914USD5_9BILA